MKKLYASFLGILLYSNYYTQKNEPDFKVYKTSLKNEARSAQRLMESLIGEGVVLKSFSITKTSGEEAFGFFEDKQERLGMKKGLVMTTGGISSLSGKNTSPGTSNNTHDRAEGRSKKSGEYTGYPDLEKLIPNKHKTFDACVIELDLIPTADTLSFNYVFGSEEYDEFVGSSYNDVFAFFINGKGIEKQKNLAVIPGTDIPVSVNSINNGPSAQGSYKCKPSNPTYYISNADGHVGVEYDGLTKLMQIRQAVVPYETYHIKLAIADVSDDSYDSGVFIEGKSFISYERTYHVLYGKNEKQIEGGYKTLLDNLSKEYKKHPAGKIIITGHTDGEGEKEYNMSLSCERAQLVANYIKSRGISEDRIFVDCKGESMPEYDNRTEIGKHMNRRVEIKIGGNAENYTNKKKEDASFTAETSGLKKCELIKNFPNPFDGITTVEAYVLPEIKQANIIICDINGRQIKNIYLLERGYTSAYFDAQYFSKGIYTATLFADGQPINSLKMVLQ